MRWRDKRRAELEAAATAALQEHELTPKHDGNAEGVEATRVDEFDEVFGDGADLMDVNLPKDSAVSQREASLLENLNKKLEEIEFQACDGCLEEGFDLNLADGWCSRCRNDTGHPVRKWSAANKVHPGKKFYRPSRSVTQLIS